MTEITLYPLLCYGGNFIILLLVGCLCREAAYISHWIMAHNTVFSFLDFAGISKPFQSRECDLAVQGVTLRKVMHGILPLFINRVMAPPTDIRGNKARKFKVLHL